MSMIGPGNSVKAAKPALDQIREQLENLLQSAYQQGCGERRENGRFRVPHGE